MISPQSRTYVTTTTNRWTVAFLSDMEVVGRYTKITCLRLIFEGNLIKSTLNTQLQQQYRINKRQANSLIAYVERALKSAKQRCSSQIEQLQGEIKHVTNVIEKLDKQSTLGYVQYGVGSLGGMIPLRMNRYRLRTIPIWELGEVGENPTGSRRTARRRIVQRFA